MPLESWDALYALHRSFFVHIGFMYMYMHSPAKVLGGETDCMALGSTNSGHKL